MRLLAVDYEKKNIHGPPRCPLNGLVAFPVIGKDGKICRILTSTDLLKAHQRIRSGREIILVARLTL
jgi:hypothetical protein